MSLSVIHIVAVLVLGIFTLVSCQASAPQKAAETPKKDSCSASKDQDDDEGDDSDEEDDEADDDGANLLADETYTDDVKPILEEKCTRCHSDSAEDDVKQTPYLTSEDDVRSNIDKIVAQLSDGAMPPENETPTLDSGDLAVFEAWQSAAADDSSTDDEADESDDDESGDDAVFYDDTIEGILEDNCVSCHTSGGDSPDLSTYAKARDAADDALEAIQDGTMPKDQDELSDSDKEAFAAWVNADMPESEDSGDDDDDASDDDECE